MPFTDEDLRVLKAMTQAGDWPVSGKSLQSLLTRLEAAEEIAIEHRCECGFMCNCKELREAWRTAKGE